MNTTAAPDDNERSTTGDTDQAVGGSVNGGLIDQQQQPLHHQYHNINSSSFDDGEVRRPSDGIRGAARLRQMLASYERNTSGEQQQHEEHNDVDFDNPAADDGGDIDGGEGDDDGHPTALIQLQQQEATILMTTRNNHQTNQRSRGRRRQQRGTDSGDLFSAVAGIGGGLGGGAGVPSLSMTPTALLEQENAILSTTNHRQGHLPRSQPLPPDQYRLREFDTKQQIKVDNQRSRRQRQTRDNLSSAGAFAVEGMGFNDVSPTMDAFQSTPATTTATATAARLAGTNRPSSSSRVHRMAPIPTGIDGDENDDCDHRKYCSRWKRSTKLRVACCCIVSFIAIVTLIVGAVMSKNGSKQELTNRGSGNSNLSPIEQELWNIVGYLSQYNESVLDDRNSPQRKAMNWLISTATITTAGVSSSGESVDQEQDNGGSVIRIIQSGPVVNETARAAATATATSAEQIIITDQRRLEVRYAIAVLYYATNGIHWYDGMNFLSPLHECNWTSTVTSSAATATEAVATFRDTTTTTAATSSSSTSSNVAVVGVICDLMDAVSSLVIDENNLSGTIPEEIIGISTSSTFISSSSLSSSTSNQNSFYEFRIRNNPKLVGRIPESIGSLNDLTILDLSNNGLSSTLPTTMSTLTNLRQMLMGYNNLSGSLFPQIAWLSELVTLNVTSNKFDEKLFDDDDNCALSGNGPGCGIRRWALLRRIKIFDISHCKFGGKVILNFISGLDRLEEFYFNNNNFEGNMLVGNEKFLKVFVGSSNMLTGSIPWSSLTHAIDLTHFDLSNNMLTSVFPSENNNREFTPSENNNREVNNDIDYSWPNLDYIDFSNNQVSGEPIPESIDVYFPSLQQLRLSNNQFSGTLPTTLGNLNDLQRLDLSWNNLSGSLPSELGSISNSNLEYLLLNDNTFNGTVPVELSNLSSLRYVTFHNNEFFGDLEFMCTDSKPYGLIIITADCDETTGEVVSCSTSCCECNALEFSDGLP